MSEEQPTNTQDVPMQDGADQQEKLPAVKEGKLIIRNLGFDIKDKHLQKDFAKFGTIVSVNVPVKNENNLNRGFGFIEYSSKEEAKKAIDAMNGQKYKGRVVQMELSAPQRKYEHKITKIMENTKMNRQDIVVPKVVKDEKEEKKKAKEEAETKRKAEQEQKKVQQTKAKEAAKVKEQNEEAKLGPRKTLFVRNVGYDTTQEQFKEFMERFGPVKYAVLCKMNDLKDEDNNRRNDDSAPHKGTGFVQFKDPKAADQLIELSKQIEQTMDAECKEKRMSKKKQDKSAINLIQAELELNGRRLVIMEAVTRSDLDSKKFNDGDKKKMDKRNLAMKKEGLLNEENWIHKTPRLTEKALEVRQHLLKEKETALTKSTNLFISKKRITIRHLPKREFFEKELKELMNMVIDEWIKAKKAELEQSSEALKKASQALLGSLNKKKLLKQVKILRDKEKIDTQSGEKLASGIGFAEFDDEALALFAVRYLNNMELIANKGLIVDFSLEDARQLHKREQKLERQKKVQAERKREEKLQKKKEDSGKLQIQEGQVIELGKKKSENKQEKVIKNRIDQIEDMEVLHRMLRECKSRGKKQRIKKRIDKLSGVEPIPQQAKEVVTLTNVPKDALKSQKQVEKPVQKVQQKPEQPKLSAQDKVKELLKKRDDKIKRKEEAEKKKRQLLLTEEDREIMKKVKNSKKNAKRQRARETDDFDDILDQYKNKVLKKISKKGKESGPAFEEIEMDSD